MSFSLKLLLIFVASWLAQPLSAKTLERADVALQRLFPGAKVERKNTILSKEEQSRVDALYGDKAEQSLVTFYQVTTKEGKTIYAYLDAHRVRTLPETVMICVDEAGEIRSVDVLVFREPPDYMPKRAWYEQFYKRKLSNDLKLNRGIQGVSGATLTARATTKASRKILSIHQIMMARRSEAAGEG